MKQPIFTGSCTAIVTPYRGLTIDYDKMAELIEQQYANGATYTYEYDELDRPIGVYANDKKRYSALRRTRGARGFCCQKECRSHEDHRWCWL